MCFMLHGTYAWKESKQNSNSNTQPTILVKHLISCLLDGLNTNTMYFIYSDVEVDTCRSSGDTCVNTV